MKPPVWWTLWWFGILVCLTPALAYWQTRDTTYNVSISAGGGGSCAQSTAYFAATSLDATHKTAIDTLICGRVSSGVFAKLDVWNMLATTNAADALVNMAQPGTFNTTIISTPTFTSNAGYAGVDASTSIALDTHFNPSSSMGACDRGGGLHPCYIQDSAHLSIWSNTNHNPAANAIDIGMDDSGAANNSFIAATLTSGTSADFIVNSNGFSGGSPISDSLGHYVAVRTSSTNLNPYKNATNLGALVQNDATVANGNIYVLALGISTGGVMTLQSGSSRQIMTFSIGGALSGADVTDLCHATNVYLTTIAGLSAGTC
jgi:hypothetical protein